MSARAGRSTQASRSTRGHDTIYVSTVVDSQGADAYLQRRLRRVEDVRPVLRRVANTIRHYYKLQYRAGTGWAALSEAYAARKAQAGIPARRLVLTGELEASLTQTGVRFARETITRDSVEVRSLDHVGNLLRNGTSSMPARDPGRIDLDRVGRDSRILLLAWVNGDRS